MATLDQLVEQGVLRPQLIELKPGEFPDRKLFVTPEFREWLNTTVKEAEPFHKSDAKLRYQAYDIIKTFITGKPFPGNRLFKRMSPASDDIYELRTQDLRFFGWFPRKDCFIAVVGDTFEQLKADASLYEKHRIDCIAFRKEIDLDEPKYQAGAGEHDVVSS